MVAESTGFPAACEENETVIAAIIAIGIAAYGDCKKQPD
jgi:hypothetical protein